MQLVGYGTDPVSGLDYFTVRNSWTPLWGEAGYMRLHRSRNASCGIDLRCMPWLGLLRLGLLRLGLLTMARAHACPVAMHAMALPALLWRQSRCLP